MVDVGSIHVFSTLIQLKMVDAITLQYARIVREVLCELELPYILQSVGQGSTREKLLNEISGSKEVSLWNENDFILMKTGEGYLLGKWISPHLLLYKFDERYTHDKIMCENSKKWNPHHSSLCVYFSKSISIWKVK